MSVHPYFFKAECTCMWMKIMLKAQYQLGLSKNLHPQSRGHKNKSKQTTNKQSNIRQPLYQTWMMFCLPWPCGWPSLACPGLVFFWIQSSQSLIEWGGRNSSVGSAWAGCPQRRGFDPPLGTFSVEGIFPLELNMGSNSIPPKTPSDESINRGLVCAYMHFIARTQKILTLMS